MLKIHEKSGGKFRSSDDSDYLEFDLEVNWYSQSALTNNKL